MEGGSSYIAAANLFWLNLWWNATPNLPLNKAGVQIIKDKWFSSPMGIFPMQVKEECYGPVMFVSPEGPFHALILAIAESITNGANDKDLRTWRNCILTICVRFKKCQND